MIQILEFKSSTSNIIDEPSTPNIIDEKDNKIVKKYDTFEKRKKTANALLKKYPEKIPAVIIPSHREMDIKLGYWDWIVSFFFTIESKKTYCDFKFVLDKEDILNSIKFKIENKLKEKIKIYTIDCKLAHTHSNISSLYDRYKNEDGILYFYYTIYDK